MCTVNVGPGPHESEKPTPIFPALVGVDCKYCQQPLYSVIPVNGLGGVGECKNEGCLKTRFLVASGSAYPTFRCVHCGFRDLLFDGGARIQHLNCVHCPEKISWPRVLGKKI
jgi:hypothetical protein